MTTTGRAGLVIAVDGPSGSGKSSAARGAARALGLRYLDTGAMYRAVTLWMLRHGVEPADQAAVAASAHRPVIEVGTDPDEPGGPAVVLDGDLVTGAIRGRAVSNAVSAVSAVPEVRARLVAMQRAVIASDAFQARTPRDAATLGSEASRGSEASPGGDVSPGGEARSGGEASPGGEAGSRGEASPGGEAGSRGEASPGGDAGHGSEAGPRSEISPGGAVSTGSAASASGAAGPGGQGGPGGDGRLGGIVVEGRDIGTVVAPDAQVKVFLTASEEARAQRRTKDLASDPAATLSVTQQEMTRRDRLDSTRAASPLLKAPDAVEIDSTPLTLDEVIAQIIALAQRRAVSA